MFHPVLEPATSLIAIVAISVHDRFVSIPLDGFTHWGKGHPSEWRLPDIVVVPGDLS
jgi:hypothetical protein